MIFSKDIQDSKGEEENEMLLLKEEENKMLLLKQEIMLRLGRLAISFNAERTAHAVT